MTSMILRALFYTAGFVGIAFMILHIMGIGWTFSRGAYPLPEWVKACLAISLGGSVAAGGLAVVIERKKR